MEVGETNEKKCNTCKKPKPLNHFPVEGATRRGKHSKFIIILHRYLKNTFPGKCDQCSTKARSKAAAKKAAPVPLGQCYCSSCHQTKAEKDFTLGSRTCVLCLGEKREQKKQKKRPAEAPAGLRRSSSGGVCPEEDFDQSTTRTTSKTCSKHLARANARVAKANAAKRRSAQGLAQGSSVDAFSEFVPGFSGVDYVGAHSATMDGNTTASSDGCGLLLQEFVSEATNSDEHSCTFDEWSFGISNEESRVGDNISFSGLSGLSGLSAEESLFPNMEVVEDTPHGGSEEESSTDCTSVPDRHDVASISKGIASIFLPQYEEGLQA